MNNRGVTLIELIVVVGIIGILVVALAFSYQGWQGRYKVEGAIKALYTDLVNARAQAVTRSATFLADFQNASPPCPPSPYPCYRIANDTSGNGNGAIDAGEVLPTFPKTVPYTMYAYSYNGAAMTAKTLANVLINFDSQGRISSPVLLVSPENPVDAVTNKVITGVISLTSGPTDDVGQIQADYDCLVLSPTKINIGKMQTQGGSWICNVK